MYYRITYFYAMKKEETSSIVRISNVLNLTRQEFTTPEKYIFLNTLLQLKNRQGFNIGKDNEIIELKISSSDFKETNKNRIREAIDKITSRKIYFERPLEEKFGYIVPIPVAIYEKGEITIQIIPMVKKLFLELADGYTETDLKAILNLTSVYAIRLYELLSQYRNQGTWTIQLDKLKELLNLKTKYKDFRQLRVHILEYSQKELLEHCGLYFTWDIAAKEKRRITALTFTISTKQEQEKQQIKADIKVTMDYIKSLTPKEIAEKSTILMQQYNLTDLQIDYILSDNAIFNNFIKIHAIIENMIENNKPPRDRTAYLAKSLGLDKVKFQQKK